MMKIQSTKLPTEFGVNTVADDTYYDTDDDNGVDRAVRDRPYADGASDDSHVDKLSRVVRKPVFCVSGLVRHRPECTTLKDG